MLNICSITLCFPGRRIVIITDTFDHELVVKNVTLINLCSMPMSHLLEALNSDEVNLKDYNLFVTILGYNDLELDKRFFEIYYKHVLDMLQRQSLFAHFMI